MRLHPFALAALPLVLGLVLGCTTKTGIEWVKDLPDDAPPNKAESISIEGAEDPGAMEAENFGEPRTKADHHSDLRGTKADAGTMDELPLK
jgi:hypothetical protein